MQRSSFFLLTLAIAFAPIGEVTAGVLIYVSSRSTAVPTADVRISTVTTENGPGQEVVGGKTGSMGEPFDAGNLDPKLGSLRVVVYKGGSVGSAQISFENGQWGIGSGPGRKAPPIVVELIDRFSIIPHNVEEVRTRTVTVFVPGECSETVTIDGQARRRVVECMKPVQVELEPGKRPIKQWFFFPASGEWKLLDVMKPVPQRAMFSNHGHSPSSCGCR